jgi:hypothetical protein
MRTRLAWLAACAAVTILAAGEPAAVTAQPVFYPGSPAVLPPYEILTIARSVGLEPLGRPVRSGETYGLRAVNPAGQVVQVVVHARMGRILRVVPATRAAGAIPPNPVPYPAPGAMVPDGYGPNSRIAVYPPQMGEMPYPERTERSSDSPTAADRSAKENAKENAKEIGKTSPAPLPRARPAPPPQAADAAVAPSTAAPARAPAAESPAAILE